MSSFLTCRGFPQQKLSTNNTLCSHKLPQMFIGRRNRGVALFEANKRRKSIAMRYRPATEQLFLYDTLSGASYDWWDVAEYQDVVT